MTVEQEACAKCEKVVYEAEGLPAGKMPYIHIQIYEHKSSKYFGLH